jgi:hypothetical protein
MTEFSGCRSVVVATPAPLAITTWSVPDGSVVLPYSARLNSTGGLPPLTWSVTSGSLPGGLSLDPGTGAIAGTPAPAGNYTFTVEVRDSADPQHTATQTLTLMVYSHAIVGTLLWDRLSITNRTHQPADITAGKLNGPFYSGQYNTNDGTYSIPVPPETYDVAVYVPLGGRHFPGEYFGYLSSIVVDGTPHAVAQDLDCSELIHLTAPGDNAQEVGTLTDPPTYPEYPSPVTFRWDSITDATTYHLVIQEWQEPPDSVLVATQSTRLTDSQATVDLDATGAAYHYEATINAYNASNVLVGSIMVVYSNGYGWDYRFRVAP